ncbi:MULTISPECIES: aspartate aminotransferase family protein [Micromonospora]|uniref:alanine--glyoxylate transaminase n=1 Tax=Micromonospora chalcea TaxID=1874 RepID=A0ABX9XY75_MICCH|nr:MULTISPECIES: aspartate aminotransferase family protein [Micromonospora]MBQ1064149.1 aspartate aminotransferase family protein [Micromonospora sp. C41]ODB80398.1 aminotransferase class III [Micromonospora sp. II]RQW88517.1 aspartate aminotransferase family protein [Micromonospora chalcea]RQX24439.1 aspartate aminotransferase family protein [Micromonospora chalcea]
MTSDDLLARHRAVLPSWMPLYYAEPLELVAGSGRRVTDAAGRTYLDFFGGVLTTMVGHDIPEIREAVERQLRTGLVHTSTLYLIRRQVELAEKIARLSGIPDARVFFTNSGTEANEAALLVATNHRRSHQILAVRNSYHGRSYATMGVTGNRGWSASALNPLQVAWLHSGERLRGLLARLDAADRVDAAVEDLREVLATQTAGEVACLIAEPVQGVGGFVHGPDGLFAAWKKVLDEHGILLISDEVQTGWGRTGEHFWGYQAHGVTPDLLTFAKGIGNGFALAGVVGRAEVLESVPAISFSTFGGNPVSTAAGNAVLDYLLDHDLQGNAARVGAILGDGLRAATAGLDRVAEVRGKGLMLAVEFVHPGTVEPDAALTTRVFEACRAGGLLVGKGGLYGNVIRMGPPLTLTEDEAREGLAILVDAIRASIEA